MAEKRIISVGPDQGEAMFVLGDVITFKITGEDSDHAYFLTEIRSLPGGGPAFLHTHIPQETFWILEGDYEVGAVAELHCTRWTAFKSVTKAAPNCTLVRAT